MGSCDSNTNVDIVVARLLELIRLLTILDLVFLNVVELEILPIIKAEPIITPTHLANKNEPSNMLAVINKSFLAPSHFLNLG